ncbi:MAG TPA: ATP-binding protein [Polyangiales bacterium]
MPHALLSTEIKLEVDLVLARKRARQIAAALGFEPQDQTRIATAVSEIARNAFQYASGGRVQFSVDDTPRGVLLIVEVTDQGGGIADLEAVLDGSYRSQTGAGLGISSARRLMDGFRIDPGSGKGVRVQMEKRLRTPLALTPELRARIADELARERLQPENLVEEVRQQNQELARALEELRQSQRDLELLNRELEETNRGVMVLYNELQEQAEALRRSTAAKSQFFSEMNHEVRTPINSILKLSELLLNGTIGAPQAEQQTALGYMRQSAQQLSELVDDLLDLAKSEAGKLVVRPSSFTVDELFGGLRGMFRPLHTRDEVKLVFENVQHLPPMHSDEGKVAQIMRNFISNALKFTDRGTVTVSAQQTGRDEIVFSVRDTGIGIDLQAHAALFEPFVQIDSPRQRRVKGTGLGLSLTRALSELLGGKVAVESTPGQGSHFSVQIPRVYRAADAPPLAAISGEVASDPSLPKTEKLLIIDDDEVARFLLRGVLNRAGRIVLEASSGSEGLEQARSVQPSVIFLDLQMPGMNGFEVLDALAADPALASIPVVIHTANRLTADERARLEQRSLGILSKDLVNYSEGMAAISAVLAKAGLRTP